MQYIRVGANKISNHNVGSPLWQGMVACQQCHAESADWLKAQVIAIQDRTTSLLNRAGYATAVAAKLFEAANKAQADGKNIDQKLYDQAKDLYLEAFYRLIFIGAENSVGFHNPTEAARIWGIRWPLPEEARPCCARPWPRPGWNPGRHQPGAGQVPEQPGGEALELHARRRIQGSLRHPADADAGRLPWG